MSDPVSFDAAGTPPVDPFAEIAQPAKSANSTFAKLLEDAKKEVKPPNFSVTIEGARPGYVLRFSGDLPRKSLELWNDRARKGPAGTPAYDQIDSQILSKILIAQQCIGIVKDGELIRDDQGNPVTFMNPEFQIALGTPDMANLAAAAFLGSDPWVEAVGTAILRGTNWLLSAEADADPLGS